MLRWGWSKRTSRLDFPSDEPNFPARLAKWYDDSGGADLAAVSEIRVVPCFR